MQRLGASSAGPNPHEERLLALCTAQQVSIATDTLAAMLNGFANTTTGNADVPKAMSLEEVKSVLPPDAKDALRKRLDAVQASLERDHAEYTRSRPYESVLVRDLRHALRVTEMLGGGSRSSSPPDVVTRRSRSRRVSIGESLGLAALRIAVRMAVDEGEQPLVLVDMDHTLVRSGGRYTVVRRALGEHLGLESLRNAIPDDDCERRLHTDVSEEIDRRNLQNSEAAAYRSQFRLLADTLAAVPGLDPLIPGAVEYVRSLADQGANLVYLTARTELVAGANAALLQATGFPFRERDRVITRPLAHSDIVDYKKNVVLALLSERKRIVGVIDDDAAQQEMFSRVLPSSVRLTPHYGRHDTDMHIRGRLTDYTEDSSAVDTWLGRLAQAAYRSA